MLKHNLIRAIDMYISEMGSDDLCENSLVDIDELKRSIDFYCYFELECVEVDDAFIVRLNDDHKDFKPLINFKGIKIEKNSNGEYKCSLRELLSILDFDYNF